MPKNNSKARREQRQISAGSRQTEYQEYAKYHEAQEEYYRLLEEADLINDEYNYYMDYNEWESAASALNHADALAVEIRNAAQRLADLKKEN